MASPRKQSKQPSNQGRGLSEPLLPLHLALGWIIVRVFPLNDDCQPLPVYSQLFTANVLRIIAREVLEVGSKPATFPSLRDELDPLMRSESTDILKRNNKTRSRGQIVQEELEHAEKYKSWLTEFGDNFRNVADGCAFLDRLEKELRDRLNHSDDDEPTELPEPIERHSPLGVFSRNLLNTLRKLSFDETGHLAREVARWCGIDLAGPSKPVTMWSLDRKSGMEDSLDKRIKAMQDYQAANASGDHSNALASLRRFYDYQFPSAGRGQHQHALLSIASFHYSTGGLESARAAVDEAIRVARTAGDKVCLQHCLSLSQRLETETKSVAFSSTETIRVHQGQIPRTRLANASTPMDELWSVKAALDMGEPVHVAFRRIHSALGKDLQVEQSTGDQENRGAKQWRTGQKLDMAAWHATQAGLWGMLELHEELAFDDLTPWDDGKMTVTLAQAQRKADQADYDGALATLLDKTALQGMSIAAYHRWARLLWGILERRATMNDESECLAYLSAVQAPKATSTSSRLGPGGPSRENGHPPSMELPSMSDFDASRSASRGHISRQITLVQEEIRSSLRKATKLQSSSSPPHTILPHVLSAVQLSSELGLWGLYRFGVVVLCEVLLSMEGMGMATKVIREIEQVWEQILGSGDQEVIARGALSLGKAKLELALDHGSAELLFEASDHLTHSLECATKVESRSLIMENTTLLSLISTLQDQNDSLDDSARNEMVERYISAKTEMGGNSNHLDLVRKVGDIIKMVGVRVAEGWK
ncbi:hypothetical protein IAR55_002237 [Kwoniella newhampshirensis]|uniref:Anaphase-promoting complex subunit 5 n=1 Tax=Kwoniella newhampshirensis TaxID=1651941 RepID=A0AAW0Z0Y4_9TREE